MTTNLMDTFDPIENSTVAFALLAAIAAIPAAEASADAAFNEMVAASEASITDKSDAGLAMLATATQACNAAFYALMAARWAVVRCVEDFLRALNWARGVAPCVTNSEMRAAHVRCARALDPSSPQEDVR